MEEKLKEKIKKMRYLKVAVSAGILLGVVITVTAVDIGFEFQYTTNKDEHLNYPVKFENPLPKWLKGIFVSDHHT